MQIWYRLPFEVTSVCIHITTALSAARQKLKRVIIIFWCRKCHNITVIHSYCIVDQAILRYQVRLNSEQPHGIVKGLWNGFMRWFVDHMCLPVEGNLLQDSITAERQQAVLLQLYTTKHTTAVKGDIRIYFSMSFLVLKRYFASSWGTYRWFKKNSNEVLRIALLKDTSCRSVGNHASDYIIHSI